MGDTLYNIGLAAFALFVLVVIGAALALGLHVVISFLAWEVLYNWFLVRCFVSVSVLAWFLWLFDDGKGGFLRMKRG